MGAEKRLQKLGRDPASGDGADDAARCKHRSHLEFGFETSGIVVEFGIIQSQDFARRIFAVGYRLREQRRALADETRIGTEE